MLVSSLQHGLLWAATLFNFFLCFIDTNVTTLGPQHVMLAEGAVLAAAVALPFALQERVTGRWDLLFALLLLNWLLLSLLRGGADPKLFRDVAIIPVFVAAGIASRERNLHKNLFWLHMFILAMALWEAFALETFVAVFSIAEYYAHTRGLQPDDWWISNGLYLSSVRPEARFLFPSLPIHRLSSVFMEPVSLGNYVIVATIWLSAFWRQLPRTMAWAAAAATVLLLIGCDSRLATAVCCLILAGRFVAPWIPTFLPLAIGPLVVATMFALVHFLGWQTGSDDFPGRIAYSVSVFQSFNLADFAGITVDKLDNTADAGLAYVVNAQSILGAIVLWVILFTQRSASSKSVYLYFAVAIYLALNLVVSWSLFSIKTAAILWFLFGRAVAADRRDGETETGKSVSPA